MLKQILAHSGGFVYVILKFNPFSVGIDFRRQILTSKVDPHTQKSSIPGGRT